MQFLPLVIFLLIVVLSASAKKKAKAQPPQEEDKQAILRQVLQEAEIRQQNLRQQELRQKARVLQETQSQQKAPSAARPLSDFADMTYASPEGTELHEDKTLHGEHKPAAKEPIASPTSPRYTSRQLREAFVMKEILDAPLSRRTTRRQQF